MVSESVIRGERKREREAVFTFFFCFLLFLPLIIVVCVCVCVFFCVESCWLLACTWQMQMGSHTTHSHKADTKCII